MAKHILVVEDDMQNYQLVANLAILEGYTVQHARTSEQGLTLVEQDPPCLILLDLRLPGMDGWEFASIVKGSSQYSHIPIVAVSVQVDPADSQNAMRAGCDDYLAKPFNVKELRGAIQHYAIC